MNRVLRACGHTATLTCHSRPTAAVFVFCVVSLASGTVDKSVEVGKRVIGERVIPDLSFVVSLCWSLQ
jgi:hypothetical protein